MSHGLVEWLKAVAKQAVVLAETNAVVDPEKISTGGS